MSVDEPPVQIVDGEALAVTFGEGLTVTVTLAVTLHPVSVVPVTEYVVVVTGLTVILDEVAPVLQE